jgi:transposase
MSFEVIQKVGKHQYIYLADGYRNSEGKLRQRRTPIGKVDPVTGEKIYKQSYVEKCKEEGKQIHMPERVPLYSIENLRKSSVRAYCLSWFLRKVSDNIGLTDALASSIPAKLQEILTMAMFMVATGDPLMYCNDWLFGHDSLPVSNLSSQRISDLFGTLKFKERDDFYAVWSQLNLPKESEYVALDITSESSYSEFIDDLEWGYNRDHEKLRQINLCMMFGEQSRLPVYQELYNGSLKDVSTLQTTLAKFSAISGGRKIVAVMDKGFYSQRNVTQMLRGVRDQPIDFLIAMPFSSAFARRQVESERQDIDRIENTIVINGYSMRALTKVRAWTTGVNVFAHICYSAKKANGIREDLFAKVALLKESAEKNPVDCLTDEECQRYLSIRKSGKQSSGYSVSVRGDVIEKELSTAGWLILISNVISDAKVAMSVYRDKDVVEKCFLRIKHSIDLKRLRVHSNENKDNKMFIGFVASIIMAEINRVMADKKLFKQYTMPEMLKLLDRQKVQYINGDGILYPINKSQRLVFEAFGFDLPMLL